VNWRFLRVSFGMAAWILGLTLTLYALNVGKIRPISGAHFIDQVAFCETFECTTTEPQSLPFFGPTRFDVTRETQYMRAVIEIPTRHTGLQAVYLPKFTDGVDVWVNEQSVHVHDQNVRLWNTPLLISLPSELMQGDIIEIKLALSGPPSEGLDLQPFYFGPHAVLSPYYDARYFFGPSLARFGLGLMIVLGSAFLVVWSFRRQDMEYLWVGLACTTVTLPLIHFGYGLSFGGYKIWTLLWVMQASLFVLLNLLFLLNFLNLSLRWPAKLHFYVHVLACWVVYVSPAGYSYALVMWASTFITVPSAITALTIFWLNRDQLSRVDLNIYFPCLSFASALGLYALYLFIDQSPERSMHLFHLMPLIMSLACLWLIMSRLIHSLRGYEMLTESLSDKVAEKSAELEASFAQLADIRRREAIAEERDRIMLDLHDGIGGQLVSTLAYMQSNDVGDEKVRRALEDAMRDLALMLDSMQNHDSLVTLLGMLRTRLEGLLSEHGIAFDWQVHGEPVLANPGPSQSLHLARIVQEAITNVIKHAHADTITIFVDENEIRISDNGQGFDQDAQASREHPSNGIANMKRRSEAIGAQLLVASTPKGTDISLLMQ